MSERFLTHIGSQVTVYSGKPSISAYDSGELSYVDEFWIEITKARGETLMIPITEIQSIKFNDISPQECKAVLFSMV